MWLLNTYKLVENDIHKKISSVLNKVLLEESSIISDELPEGTQITGALSNDSISLVSYLYDGIWQLGRQYSINEIDSLTDISLKEVDIKSKFLICLIEPKSKVIRKKSKEYEISTFGIVKTEIIPTRLDNSEGIQLILINPYFTIFKRMGLLMIATAIMMFLVIGCIFYQIKIIIRQNKISQLREDFSNAMIHDMKTPLSTIMMSLNFLHNPKLDEKPEMKNRFLNIAESEADHLLTLTNKILTISKLENKKLEMNKSKVVLPPIIEKLTEKFSAKSVKPIHFIIDLKVEEIYADKEYLEEVISNLIDNAIKYSKESVEIKISSYDNDVNTIIKVHDNGLGIPQKYQLTIFNKYERGAASKRSRKNGPAGFGLGLNFVYQVITAHEGKIFVNSIEGEFTEFIISLPQIIQKL